MGNEMKGQNIIASDYRVEQGMGTGQPKYNYLQDWKINTRPVPGSSEEKSPYLDNGTDMLNPERYFSKEFKEQEDQMMWPKTWLLAGRVSDLTEVGSFLTFEINKESIIVVCSSPGEVQAFYNVCQHRGTRLVDAPCGKSSVFRCKYHSWAWSLEGSLVHLPDRETFREEVLAGDLDLPKVRCSTWGGFVFVCMDESAPSLEDYLDVIPAHLDDYKMEDMVVVKESTVTWPANWKVVADAFTETYHVATVHPEILPIFEEYYQQRDLYDNGMSRMLMPFGLASSKIKDQSVINPGLKAMLSEVGIDPETFQGKAADVRVAIQKAKRSLAKDQKAGANIDALADAQLTDDWNYHLFPNVTFNAHPEGVLVQRFRPHPTDPEQSFYDVMVLLHPIADKAVVPPAYMGVPEGADCSGRVRPELEHLDYGDGGVGFVLEQDGETVPLLQAGVRSRGFKGVRLSEPEQRIRHYHREIDNYIAGRKW